MVTHNPNSQLLALHDSLSTTESNSDLQKAWHLLSILLSIGHPISPFELASRCTLFHITSDLVQFLCLIPNSPITLTTSSSSDGVLVTVSVIGLFAFQRFAFNLNFIFDTITNSIVTCEVDCISSSSSSSCCLMLLKDATCSRVNFRKRKRIQSFDCLPLQDSACYKRVRKDSSSKVNFHMTEHIRKWVNVEPNFSSLKQLIDIVLPPNLFIKTGNNELIYKLKNVERIGDEIDKHIMVLQEEQMRIMQPEIDEESVSPIIVPDSEDVCGEAKVDEVDLKSRMDVDAAPCNDDFEKSNNVSVLCINGGDDACNAANDCVVETLGVVCKEEELLTDPSNMKGETEIEPINPALLGVLRKSDSKRKDKLTPMDKVQGVTCKKNQIAFPSKETESVDQKKLSKPSARMKLTFGDAMSPRQQSVNHSIEGSKAVATIKENRQVKRNLNVMGKGQKPKQKHESMHNKEGKKDLASFSSMDQVQTKDLPNFESYIVEEEEGSGGYGIVYRARRKSDGSTVAIKCPHANAHKHHVNNEQRMLERFGGKNFVIKYEGRFKSGNSDCFVLEHVDHDRPEVLKKDIDLFHLRWYGYCMFRALASLHKQEIVHRDVKPGNFLFSCKSTKGYLIDFNLAMDLRQKFGTAYKLKMGNDVSFSSATLSTAPPTKNRRFSTTKSLGAVNQEATKGLKPSLELKNQKKRAVNRPKADNDLNGWNAVRSQGAEGSGITSVKDVTSTRTPSAERLREPLPCQGRKELISLLQEAMLNPTYEASNVPASMRKRIAAPPRKVDERLIYITPMPLHSTGIAVPGKCLINSKEDGKPKKEGPCVGTKGFRAPEVLFRSTYQGTKVDIWSAGVTLLYLIIGKTPFYGDPEQNIKDIAKLRGREDLWEVSKLHDRESSFPAELYNTESLPSLTLREWCKINTKRQDFLDIIPSSLLNLVDKCLTVNPRLRISAVEALKHEFFAPCHEELRKQRLLRQGHNLDSGTSHLPSREQSIGNEMEWK